MHGTSSRGRPYVSHADQAKPKKISRHAAQALLSCSLSRVCFRLSTFNLVQPHARVASLKYFTKYVMHLSLTGGKPENLSSCEPIQQSKVPYIAFPSTVNSSCSHVYSTQSRCRVFAHRRQQLQLLGLLEKVRYRHVRGHADAARSRPSHR